VISGLLFFPTKFSYVHLISPFAIRAATILAYWIESICYYLIKIKNSTEVFISCVSLFIFIKVVRMHDNIQDLRGVVWRKGTGLMWLEKGLC